MRQVVLGKETQRRKRNSNAGIACVSFAFNECSCFRAGMSAIKLRFRGSDKGTLFICGEFAFLFRRDCGGDKPGLNWERRGGVQVAVVTSGKN